jgi:hypothetical protein
LTRPSTPRRLEDEGAIPATLCDASGSQGYTLCIHLPQNYVDGRVKPGHDAFSVVASDTLNSASMDRAERCITNGGLAQALGATRPRFACANAILQLSQASAGANLT